MVSLIEELGRREAAARTEELSADLARAEEQVTRLAIAWEEVARVLEEPAADPEAGQDGGPAATARPASPTGAVTVPRGRTPRGKAGAACCAGRQPRKDSIRGMKAAWSWNRKAWLASG
jgi:hypothetical protein